MDVKPLRVAGGVSGDFQVAELSRCLAILAEKMEDSPTMAKKPLG